MATRKEPPLPDATKALVDKLDGDSSAEECKTAGNACFGAGCYLTAIRCYTKGLERDDADAAVLYCNRSAAYLKSPMFSGPALAVKDAEKVIEMKPQWFKGFQRLGDAQFGRKKYQEAIAAYEKALLMDGVNSATINESIHTVKKAEFEREMMRDTAPNGDEIMTEATSSRTETPGETLHEDDASRLSTLNSSNTTRTIVDETEQLIQLWSRDTAVRPDGTALKPRSVDLSQADRRAGAAYREKMLNRFRSKVDGDEELHETLRSKLEREKEVGAGTDYRNPDPYRKVFGKGTDGIGLAISADAYRTYAHKEKIW